MRRWLFAFLFCLLPGLGLADEPLNLTAQEQTWLRERLGPLRVHNELDWPPYNFNQSGQPRGYSIDYMNLLAKKLGIKIEYVSGPSWNEFLGMMQSRSLDVMLNIANTKERRDYLAFTEPYYITNVGLYVRQEENKISDLKDLAGRRIAFPKGFFFEEFIRNNYPDIKIVSFDSAPASFRAVDQGLADAVMDIPGVARRILHEEKLTTLKHAGKVTDPRFITTFSIATRLDNRILRDILQKGMDAIAPAEEQELSRKWNLKEGDDETSLFSPDDSAYLQKLGRLRFCAHPDLLPLEAITLDGAHTGVSSEFVKIIGQRLGIPLNLVQTRNWDESISFIKNHQCDLLPLAIKPPGSSESMVFTQSWLSSELVVATRHDQIYVSDIREIMQRKIGAVKGSAPLSLLKKTYPEINLIEMNSASDGLKAVEDGRLFGLIDTLPIVSRAMQAETVKGVKISGGIGLRAEYAVAVRNDDARLFDLVSRAVGSIDQDMIQGIYKRWLAVAYVERADYSYLWKLLAGIGVIGFFILFHYMKVLRVTSDLRLAHSNLEVANRSLDEKNQALDKFARTDALTGLFNRRMINETLSEEQKRFERYDTAFSVILLDLDHFKEINDRHGHHAGDEALKRVAESLREHTRATDIIGRWGGEEFVVICPSTTLDGALRLAELLRSELPKLSVQMPTTLTSSFGVATIGPGESAEELIRRADKALYQAKDAGRNRVVG
ncbi:MAG: transporter substrate-binding domain-containing protein [Alphaproteobacteria bacterium]|nr:transporter substrate-binding domain-containing protein [Alphaproteobacteria bacterium]